MRNLASSAPHVERPQLAPTWLIAAMTVMVGLALWLIYPRQNLENRLADLPESDLTNSYLGSLLRSDPDNPHLRLLLAQRQIAHGEIAAAHDTLAPVLRHPDPALHKKALWAQWELVLAAYNATDPTERPALLDALRAQIRELAQDRWPRPQTLRLASWASQLHEGAVALQLYASVLPDNPTEATHFYIASAEQALAQGDYFGSAHLYLQAKNTSPDATEARALALVAVRTLQSGNQPAAALALAQTELVAWLDEPPTLVFMVELARAAGRPEIAEQYVRHLLHMQAAPATPHSQPMAWHGPVYDDGAQWLAPGRWRLRVADQRPAQAATIMPFDEKTYLLGYQVFMENGNVEDAWQLAHTAVAQRPQDATWRKRLAQTSEWTGRQPLALQQWLHLAQSTDQESAWQAVLRLAPGLFDNHALALALRHQLRQNPGDAALLQAFVQMQEAEGEPQVAIDFLQRQHPTPQTLETLARLAEHAGQPDLALATWRKLLAHPQQRTPARALHAALLALQHNQAEQGLAWLEAAYVQSGQPPAADAEAAAELWRITGAVAYTQEQHALALDAYRRLIASAHAQAEDFDSLIQLLLPTTPEEAAEIAHQAWQHYHQPGHLVLAWTQWSARNQWQRITQSLHTLQQQPDTWASLQANPEFLRLLGTYHQNFGRLEQAQKYYEAGFALAPASDALRQALLWLFIDSNDAVAIQRLLTVYEAQWSLSSAMHDSLAAAYQALSQPQAALQRYLTPHVAEHANDFLWGMNYADALEQNQQSDQAWRLRQHLLAQQGTLGRYTRAQARARWLTQEGLDTVQRIARTRLVLTQRPGDPALDVLRELLRLDRDAQGQYSNAAAETAIGWLQDAGEYGAERGFLYQQYARSHSLRSNRPLWADITLALAEDDKASTGQLLETFDQRLPRYDRVNAAVAVGDIRLAQSAAFETQDQQTDDDPLHLQLTENLLAFSDHVGVRTDYEQLGDLNEATHRALLHWAISPRLYFDLGFASVQRIKPSNNLAQNLPEEKIFSILAGWQRPTGLTTLRISQRHGYTDTTPILLTHDQRIDNRLSWYAEIGRQLPTTESLALRLVGMKDSASLSLRYQLSRLDRLTFTQALERYHLQTGVSVGSGRHTTVEYTHTYRQDAPLVDVGAFWSTHSYSRRTDLGGQGLRAAQRILPPGADAPAADFYLPENFQFYGLQLSTNMRFEEDYTRALRPFAMVSLTGHSQLGAGYGLRLGMAGNVLGPDHLSLSWGMDKSGPASLGSTRSLSLAYRLHF